MGAGVWTWWALGNRPAFFVVLALLVGVACGPAPAAAVALGACTCLLWAFFRGARPGGLSALLLAGVLVGITCATLGAWAVVPSDIIPGRRVRLEGVVERVEERDAVTRLTVRVARVAETPARFRAALSTADEVQVVPGQRIAVETRLRQLAGPANPGEWNRWPMLWRRGQLFTGSFEGSRLVHLSAARPWRAWLAHTREDLAAMVHAATDDSDAAALFLTLAAGQRAELQEHIEVDFARSGLAHILSVSGLHVAAVALAVFVALRWILVRLPGRCFRRLEPRRIAAPAAIPLVWGYVLFTGMQDPAIRSAVMCSVLLLSHLFWRRSDALNALAVAAATMVVVDASAPFDLSVQLSFTAVLALIVLAPALRELIPVARPRPEAAGWRRRWRAVGEALLTTFTASAAVTLATAPLVLSAFQRVGAAGLLSNMACLPLSGALTLVAASASAAFVIARGLSLPLVWAGTWLSKGLLAMAHGFAQLPGASVNLPGPSALVTGLWWAGLAALALMRGRWRWAALLAPVAACIHLWGPVDSSGLTVTFLAVGHGDAIVVSSAGSHALIDGGGVPDGADTGQRYVLPYLRQHHIERLELAVLSHPHPDHALGLASALRELPTQRLFLPAGAAEGELVTLVRSAVPEADVEFVEAGRADLRLGEATVRVLGPPRDRLLLEGENDRSVALLLTHGQVTFLLPGDVEAAAEEALDLSPVTVLKAPHHGSRSSSTERFVRGTRPAYVVFCVGRGNRFGFPHPEVVDRYRTLGARCFRTDLHGAVTFRSDGRAVSVETFLPPGSAEPGGCATQSGERPADGPPR